MVSTGWREEIRDRRFFNKGKNEGKNEKVLHCCVIILFMLTLLKHDKGLQRASRENMLHTNFSSCLQRTENIGHANDLYEQSCLPTYEKSCLLERIPPMWEASFLHLRS